MLLIHGFPEFWYSWRHQLKEFKHDYRSLQILFYFNFIGYGKWLIKIHVEFKGLFFKKNFQEKKERKKKGKRQRKRGRKRKVKKRLPYWLTDRITE